MARFKIVASRNIDTPDAVDFDVVFLDGTLTPGQTFRVYEAGHWWTCTIMEATSVDQITTLRCHLPLGLGWENQYVPAIVDTEAKDMPAFRYVHDE